ncbi:MAG: hypothetical protein LBF86_08390 [Helicobacteraceae bacterium]|jgi:hypothetical protein|nr:hypothetical protein [Helicobacteraceae bacterium]
MTAFRFIFPLFALISLGCAPSHRQIDAVKSCEALFYESDSIDFQLARSRLAAQEAKDENVPLHIFAVGVGAMLSLAPIIAPTTGFAVSGGSAYIMPSLTVGYYNRFVSPKEIIDRNDYLEARREVLDALLEERECKKTIKR